MNTTEFTNKKVAILVNTVAPYRMPVYRRIARAFDTHIFVSGNESNRSNWNYNESSGEPYRVKRSFGFTVRLKKMVNDNLFDYKFLHCNPGFFTDLLGFDPDIVISSEMGFRSIVACVYGAIFRKPVWIWWGGTLHTERSTGTIKRFVRALFARGVERWISYGETSTDYLLSIGVARACILQIQNCVDEKLYQNRVQPAFDIKPKPVLLYVGQMIDRKGVEPLLESAAALQKDAYHFSLVLVGAGPKLEDYQVSAQQLGLQNTEFHPPCSPDEMPSVYRSADCLVFPTLEDVWGLVANEALLSGIPVLSSIFAGCSQEIIPQECQFNPLDAGDFKQKLKSYLDGKMPQLDISVLKPIEEVSDMIITEIKSALNARSSSG